MAPEPTAILDAKARELYDAWRRTDRRGMWNPFSGAREAPARWDEISNHEREAWREKALAAIRSKESLADELRREDRARKSASEPQAPAPPSSPSLASLRESVPGDTTET